MSTRIFVILGALFVLVYLFGEMTGNKLLAVVLMLALVAVGFIYLLVKARVLTKSEKGEENRHLTPPRDPRR